MIRSIDKPWALMRITTTSGIITLTFALSTLLLPIAIYAQGAWSPESSEGFTPRFSAAVGEVGGKTYVIGGLGIGPVMHGTIDVFDPSTGTWSTPSATGTYT